MVDLKTKLYRWVEKARDLYKENYSVISSSLTREEFEEGYVGFLLLTNINGNGKNGGLEDRVK